MVARFISRALSALARSFSRSAYWRSASSCFAALAFSCSSQTFLEIHKLEEPFFIDHLYAKILRLFETNRTRTPSCDDKIDRPEQSLGVRSCRLYDRGSKPFSTVLRVEFKLAGKVDGLSIYNLLNHMIKLLFE
jgi:hypothetical protein